MVAQSNGVLLANHSLILDVFILQVCTRSSECVHCARLFGAGRRTGALHMHRLIILTLSASVGEIFTTLVWHSASSTEEQLLAYQIILQLCSLCVCACVCVSGCQH